MALSVFLVLLLTVFYELLKVWKIGLDEQPVSRPPPLSSSESLGSSSPLEGSPSESPLTPPDRSSTPEKRYHSRPSAFRWRSLGLLLKNGNGQEGV